MAGEAPGIYMRVNGEVVPAATLPGPPGKEGPPGEEGPEGLAAIGPIVSPTAPSNPQVDTIWIQTNGVM